MLVSSFRQFTLVPARIILQGRWALPDAEGVYYVFFDRGIELLSATSYFEYSRREPDTHEGLAHLYTGASKNMYARALCHLRGGADQSGLRKTLVAIQLAVQAISQTNTPNSEVRDRHGLDLWMAANTHFAFVPCDDAREHERRLLRWTVSPLNIQRQKVPQYAAQLLRWRREFFPRDGSF